eukprot:1907618-Rhodomonas_salina.1
MVPGDAIPGTRVPGTRVPWQDSKIGINNSQPATVATAGTTSTTPSTSTGTTVTCHVTSTTELSWQSTSHAGGTPGTQCTPG